MTPATRQRRIHHWLITVPYCKDYRCADASKGKGKGKGMDTCYSAAYMSQTRDQQRFTISELAAD